MSDKCPYQKQKSYNVVYGKDYYTDIFCAKCYRHERFFTGGQSASPDLCACGCEDTIVWHEMGWIKRRRAVKKYDEDYELWRKRNQ